MELNDFIDKLIINVAVKAIPEATYNIAIDTSAGVLTNYCTKIIFIRNVIQDRFDSTNIDRGDVKVDTLLDLQLTNVINKFIKDLNVSVDG